MHLFNRTLLLFFLLTQTLKAQDTLYFDQNYDPVAHPITAKFVEIKNCDKTDTEKCVVRIFKADSMKLVSVVKYSNYKEGILNGRSSYWFPNGALCLETTYENGMKQGQERCFYQNGQVKRVLNWDHDTITGGSFFEADGTPKKEVFEEDLHSADVFQSPSYPGGEMEMFKYLWTNLFYPIKARENNIQGMVVIGFVVEKNGSIGEVKVEKSAHALLDKEALRVVSKMPAFKPGRIGEIPVRVRFSLPVRFKLE